MAVRILTEAELRQCVGPDQEALASIEQAFTWLAEGRVDMPPIMHITVSGGPGDVDIKGAYVEGLDSLAVKVASGFFGNPSLGLPSSSAMVVVLSAKTGFCEAVLLDNGYLTDLRTGLAGAVAAKHLAPANVKTVGVVGAGMQARYQIECLALVRQFERLLVFGRSEATVAQYRDDMSERLGIEVEIADSLASLVKQSHVVVTTTPSDSPLISSAWLHPGLHITAMGSDLPGKQELDPTVMLNSDVVVCDSLSQCAKMGEHQHLSDENDSAGKSIELGAVISGRATGRTSAEQVTVCDLVGVGVQDTAIANLALRAAVGRDLGTNIG